MEEIIKASVNGVPLVVVVMGLVTLAGQFGAKGKVQTASAMLIGLVLGLAYMASQVAFDSYSAVFSSVTFGLTLGLVASGLYDTGMKFSRAAAESRADALEDCPE